MVIYDLFFFIIMYFCVGFPHRTDDDILLISQVITVQEIFGPFCSKNRKSDFLGFFADFG